MAKVLKQLEETRRNPNDVDPREIAERVNIGPFEKRAILKEHAIRNNDWEVWNDFKNHMYFIKKYNWKPDQDEQIVMDSNLHKTDKQNTLNRLAHMGQGDYRYYHAVRDGKKFKKNALELQTEKRENHALLIKVLEKNAPAVLSNLEKASKSDNRIIRDIKNNIEENPHWFTKKIKSGAEPLGLSEKQIAFINSVAERQRTYENKIAEDNAGFTGSPTAGRQSITGEVINIKMKDSQWGETLKVLLKVNGTNGYYKLWGTLPKIEANVEKGDVIEFTARVTASETDNNFGFFSRPSKGLIVAEGRHRLNNGQKVN